MRCPKCGAKKTNHKYEGIPVYECGRLVREVEKHPTAHDCIARQLATVTARVGVLEEDKDAAYNERNMLVAALSKIFPSQLMRHPETDTSWEDDWRWIVCVNLPAGQATWHIQDSEVGLFGHLDVADNSWDGHTTKEKYQRLNAIAEGGGD